MTRIVDVNSIVEVVQVGDHVGLMYPASDGSGTKPRGGVVESVNADKGLLTVEVNPPGSGEYRSFKFSRIVGGTITLLTDEAH